jgi:hypothetical protein
MCPRDYKRVLLRELAAAEIRDVRFSTTQSNHTRLCFAYGGRECSMVIPGTPSDSFHGPVNARAQLRRLLRQIGALKIAVKERTEPKPKSVPQSRKQVEIATAWRQHRHWTEEQTR